MAQLGRHLRRSVGAAVATLVVAGLPTVAADVAHAADETPTVVFFTPRADQTQQKVPTTGVHVLLGADATVQSVRLSYGRTGVEASTCLPRKPDSEVFETTLGTQPTGPLGLQAAGYTSVDCQAATQVGTLATQSVAVSAAATAFKEPNTADRDTGEKLCGPFVRPRRKVAKGTTGCSAVPLGVFTSRLDGHTYARVTGEAVQTSTAGIADPQADSPTFAQPTPGVATPGGSFSSDTFREPVDLTGNPGLGTGIRRVVIRVSDGISSEAVETPVYTQVVTHVRSTTTPTAGGYAVTSTLLDQYGQPVVHAPARLTGYANGSRTPVNQLVATDVNGVATFPGVVPANGFYIAVADVDLNGSKGSAEPSFESVVGRVSKSAPGRALYHNNTRTRGAGGTVGDSLRGTVDAAARRYQWIDQDGHLAFSSLATRRAGAGRVSQPAHLTWVNAHGAPFNPRWLRSGRFETRAWTGLRRRPGLRNADMTFKQDAARHLSVEWEVKDIKPFTSAAALNAAFASLAASAQRYYGAGWQSRVQVKMLSDLSGGQPFALSVLRAAHAHGFTTMYLARGTAIRVQIPASAHAYVDFVRGAAGSLYAYEPPAWQKDMPVAKDPALTAR
ncbi:hypothetical protein [Nocardioides panacihumi]